MHASLVPNVAQNTTHITMPRENIEQVRKLIRKIEKLNLGVAKLSAAKKLNLHEVKLATEKRLFIGGAIFLAFILVFFNLHLYGSGGCWISMPSLLQHAFRRPEQCGFCENVTEIVRVSKMTPTEFEQSYAYNGRPVIVTDATKNWSATSVFDFRYIQQLYRSADAVSDDGMHCQFFPYKTEFRSLQEALSIPDGRVNYEHGTRPWYFGWSNCNYEVAQQLRKHYGRPYFLPLLSENAATDWIFMGGPALGAHMHVDNVRLPSWQAQIKGAKKWTLAPPPECYYRCTTFSAIVQTGEIVVLDTNKWYHMTEVLAGKISITIGAEYD